MLGALASPDRPPSERVESMALSNRLLGHPLWHRILELLGDHTYGLSGLELAKTLNVSRGSLYPALARAVAAGYLDALGGNATRRYVLTKVGQDKLKELSG